MKNIGLRNHNNITVSLATENGGSIFTEKINGGSIGDDYNLLLKFPQVANSAGQTFILSVNQPEKTAEEEELVRGHSVASIYITDVPTESIVSPYLAVVMRVE